VGDSNATTAVAKQGTHSFQDALIRKSRGRAVTAAR
jgi:hypothetical protein